MQQHFNKIYSVLHGSLPSNHIELTDLGIFSLFFLLMMLIIQGSAKRWTPGCMNAAGKAQAEMVSKSSKKFHKTFVLPFSPALYSPFSSWAKIYDAAIIVNCGLPPTIPAISLG